MMISWYCLQKKTHHTLPVPFSFLRLILTGNTLQIYRIFFYFFLLILLFFSVYFSFFFCLFFYFFCIFFYFFLLIFLLIFLFFFYLFFYFFLLIFLFFLLIFRFLSKRNKKDIIFAKIFASYLCLDIFFSFFLPFPPFHFFLIVGERNSKYREINKFQCIFYKYPGRKGPEFFFSLALDVLNQFNSLKLLLQKDDKRSLLTCLISPTEPLAVLELTNQSPNVPELHKIC